MVFFWVLKTWCRLRDRWRGNRDEKFYLEEELRLEFYSTG